MVCAAPAPARFLYLPSNNREKMSGDPSGWSCARVRSELCQLYGETVDTGEGYFVKAHVSITKAQENHLQRLRGPLSFQEE